jgi:outer membrane receptor protein involved in Fe transport
MGRMLPEEAAVGHRRVGPAAVVFSGCSAESGNRMTSRLLLTCLVVTLSSAPFAARGGDLADEADLHFELGTERFRAHDYRAALEHFLASNRLVPNRNVVANLGATYAALKQYPEAFRYYTQALDAETDPEQRAALSKALAKVAPLVAVLKVDTVPPGATVYIDRKDLGPRGQTPALLGFPKSKLTVFVELEGFESPGGIDVDLEPGKETPIELKLLRVVGVVKVTGSPYGALVTVENFPEIGCALPCELQLPPGRRTLQIRKDGFLPGYRRVEVPVKASITADFALAPVTGGLVVNTDERGASVEVDGHLLGFTPGVFEVPVGERVVRVGLPGFASQESKVTVAAGVQARLELSLAPIEEISVASRTAEKLEDAPGSVSVLSGNELRAMGYPTLWEAVRGERGVFLSDDHSYQSIGIRGFGPAGSYGNRVLVQIDGHSINDDWLGSSYVGYDGRTDLADLERIEIVRGPGSVLYGTGAFSGVINLVTRGHQETPGSGHELSSTLGTDGPGTLRARLGWRQTFGATAGFSLSASGLTGTGQDWYFPDLAAAGLPAESRGADGVKGGNLSLSAWWKDFALAATWNGRNKRNPLDAFVQPAGADPGGVTDQRSYAEVRWTPHLGESVELFARSYLDLYDYSSSLQYGPDGGGLTREYFWGTWIGAEARLTLRPHSTLRLMVGAEGQDHLRVEQQGIAGADTAAPDTYLNQRNPFQVGAAYLNADWTPLPWLHLSGGARVDAYSTFGASVNPRVALILKPYAGGTTKLMAGKAFRAPSIYELYYNDNGTSQLPACNPICALKPETIYSVELEHTHHFSEEWSVIGSLYGSRLTDLIALGAVAGRPDLSQYANTSQPIRSLGAEVELRREWRNGIFFTVNTALQKTSYQQDSAAADSLREVPNSPITSGGLRLSVPLLGRSLRLATRLSAESGRFDRNDQPTDPQQTRTSPFALWDVVLSGEAPEQHLRWNAGLYNAGGTAWSVPLSRGYANLLTSPEPGRSFVGQLTFTF